VVPLGHGGRLRPARSLPLTGELHYEDGFNANGIEASPDGSTPAGDPIEHRETVRGVRENRRDQGGRPEWGGPVTNGDGLLRRGSTLSVVRNQDNLIAVVRLDRSYRSGTLTRTITDANFDVPTTVAGFGPFLYAVNARFGTPPTPDTTYTVVRVSAR
jgi:hypothetical protein